MSEVIEKTRSLCNHCYSEVDAEVTLASDGVYLTKNCPQHGQQRCKIEENKRFYRASLVKGPHFKDWYRVIGATALEVTERCNLSCPSCYAIPENSKPDPSIEELVELAAQAAKPDSYSIILMGSEPTMRKDLPELITAIKRRTGKGVLIYTNGIRLASKKYAKLVLPLLQGVAFSLHTRNYLTNEGGFEKKLKALDNIVELGTRVNHISFSLRSIEDLDEVWEHCERFWGLPQHFRIRTPSQVGICDDEPFFLSRLYQAFVRKAVSKGKKVVWYPADNNPYHVMVRVGEQFFRLIHFPSVREVNLSQLQSPPYALFMPELGETNLVHQFIMQEPHKKAQKAALVASEQLVKLVDQAAVQ